MEVTDVLGQIPWSRRTPLTMFLEREADGGVLAVDAATGSTYTYADIGVKARRVAHVLRGAGLRPGEPVVWLAPPSIDAIAIWMGIAMAGGVEVGISDALKGRVLEHVIADTAARFAITHSSSSTHLLGLDDELLASFEAIFVVGNGEGKQGTTQLDLDVGDGIAPDEIATPSPDSWATMVYTSGTTGPSKGVMLSCHQLFFIGATFAEFFRIEAGSVLYHYSPYYHITGRQLVVAAMLADATLYVRDRFTPTTFWEDVSQGGCTHAITLGSAVPMLLDTGHDRDSGRLKYVWASPAMPRTYAEFSRRFGVDVAVPYGSTEMGIITDPELGAATGPEGHSGRGGKYFQISVVDEHDQHVPPGSVGEIVVRPRHAWTTYLGYWNRPEATTESNRNLWYHTGDLAQMSSDGYVTFVDRKQDFIRTRGENVSSSEVEEIIASHSAVTECAVVAVESALGESDLMAAVVPAQGSHLDPAELFDWCIEELTYFMVPTYIRIADSLPRTASGKVEKYRLRREGPTDGTWSAAAQGLRVTRSGLRHVRPSS